MKKCLAFIFLSLASRLVEAQDFIVQQDINDPYQRNLQFQMVDATDGYTAETGLTPTCTIAIPGASSYASCANAVTEIGTGTYQIALAGSEWENLGRGSLYITGTGSRPRLLNYQSVDGGSQYKQGANYIYLPSNYNNTAQWTKTGVTVTSNSTATFDSHTIADTITGDGATSEHRVTAAIVKPEGSGWYYFTTEVKAGTLNNAWIGDRGWATGGDFNTSTEVFTPTAFTYLRGWKIDKLASSNYRVHLLYSTGPKDASGLTPTVALGNGTAGSGPPSFATSGTMIFSRTKWMRAEDVDPLLIDELMPDIQSASSTTSVTLAVLESTSSSFYVNREICFRLGYTASSLVKVQKTCSCITAYNGTTKVATISPGTPSTLNSEYKYRIGGVCLNNPLTVGSVTGAVGSVTGNVGGNVTGSVGSVVGAVGSVTATTNANVVSMASDTITSSAVATSAAQEIGDTTLRRSSTNIEGSSFGDTIGYKSLYGVIAQQTHKSNAALGVRNTYKADGTTVLNSRSYTSDPLAKPITGLD